MPDNVRPEDGADALHVDRVSVSPAHGRDADSVWLLHPRPIAIGSGRLTLIDAPAFGTGFHPTTMLCLDALQELTAAERPDAVLDIGTGSGVLALAALLLGVTHAVGIDVDADALSVASENARLNGVADRLVLIHGGPETVTGTWPLVVANVLAAPLIEIAPALVRHVGPRGQLVLSGIAGSIEQEVARSYCRLGMRHVRTTARDGWSALLLRASW
jgi:ribosomal protein L11 methyltransferase